MKLRRAVRGTRVGRELPQEMELTQGMELTQEMELTPGMELRQGMGLTQEMGLLGFEDEVAVLNESAKW